MRRSRRFLMLPLIALLSALMWPLYAQTGELNDQEVEQLLKCADDKKCEVTFWTKGGWTTNTRVAVSSPGGAIVYAARAAKREYKAFTSADVTPDLRRRLIRLHVEPNQPAKVTDHAAVVDHVVIRKKALPGAAPSEPVQPVEKRTEERAWGNAYGAKVIGQALIADFDPSTLPVADWEIVVVTRSREEIHSIKAADLLKTKIISK